MRTIMLNLREDEVLTVIDALDLQRAELDPFVPANGPRAGHLKDLADFLQELLHPETFPDGHPAQVRARALQPQPEAREEGVGFSSFLHRLPKTDSGHEVGMMEVGYDANGQLCWGPRWLDINQTDEILRTALSRLAAKEQQAKRDDDMLCKLLAIGQEEPNTIEGVRIRDKIRRIFAEDACAHRHVEPAAPATSEKPEEGKR